MKKIFKILYLIFIINNCFSNENKKNDLYFCTAADAKYFDLLINLIGSIHKTNFENLKEIAVFDLGLTDNQKDFLQKIEKTKVYQIELTHPDLLKQVRVNNDNKHVPGWYAWKFVVLKQAAEMFPYFFWVDAGIVILNPVDNIFDIIIDKGLFVGNLPHCNKYQTIQHLIKKFNINDPKNNWILEKHTVISTFIGISKKVVNNLVLPLYEMTKDMKNFIDDGTSVNGFGSSRPEQAILSLWCYLYGFDSYEIAHSSPAPVKLNDKEVPIYIAIPWHVTHRTQIYLDAKSDKHYNEKYKEFIKLIE